MVDAENVKVPVSCCYLTNTNFCTVYGQNCLTRTITLRSEVRKCKYYIIISARTVLDGRFRMRGHGRFFATTAWSVRRRLTLLNEAVAEPHLQPPRFAKICQRVGGRIQHHAEVGQSNEYGQHDSKRVDAVEGLVDVEKNRKRPEE